MQSKAIVHLRVYKSNGRDSEISYSADGKVQNENILVKLRHDTLEWTNYLKHLLVNGFVKVEVEKVIGQEKESIEKEVKKAMFPTKEVVLTPEQKKIADLETKLNALTGNKDEEQPVENPNEQDEFQKENLGASEEVKDDGIKDVRAEYKRVFGKRPYGAWDIDTLKEKIKNK